MDTARKKDIKVGSKQIPMSSGNNALMKLQQHMLINIAHMKPFLRIQLYNCETSNERKLQSSADDFISHLCRGPKVLSVRLRMFPTQPMGTC